MNSITSTQILLYKLKFQKRGLIREKAADNLSAFDLLATVAGKLLEGESSQHTPDEKDQLGNAQDVVMQEQDEGNLCVKDEHCDKGINLEIGLQVEDHDCIVKEISGPRNDASPAPASVITSSHCLEKDDFLVKMDVNDDKSDFCSHSRNTEGYAPGHTDSSIRNGNESPEEHDGKGEILSGNGLDMHCSEDPEFFDGDSPAVASSDCSIKLSLGVDHYPCRDNNNVKVVTRDDDENSSECTQPSTMKAARLPARIGDRRIRKLLASKYWRVKDGDHSDTGILPLLSSFLCCSLFLLALSDCFKSDDDYFLFHFAGLRCIYRSRRTGYKRQRSQRIYPFKKRKFYHYSSLSNSDGDTGCKGVYDSSERAID